MQNQLTPTILRIAVPTPLRQLFDYTLPVNLAEKTLQPGMRVSVSFGRRNVVGIIIEITKKSTLTLDKLKPILEILDEEALISSATLQLCQWISQYYHYSLGEVIFAAIPTALRKGKIIKALPPLTNTNIQLSSPLTLNSAQQQAVTAIIAAENNYKTFVLDGITGSGKTEVYLQVINKIISQKKQALILVPEIGLTPQTIARFQERFNTPVLALHSGLTEKARLETWLHARRGDALIIIGTRSAIFTPLINPGIIIVDEEHDISFKQQEGLRYCARDLAVMRAHQLNIPLVLGSATPSLESLNNVWTNKYRYLSLPERAGNATLPTFSIIDMRNQKYVAGISESLLKLIKQHLAQHNQVLLFLNRRGFSPVLMCHHCGWIANCLRCDAPMTLHYSPSQLCCHHCGAARVVDKQCPSCAQTQLLTVGLGTERLEETLKEYFPEIGIVRIDRDTTRRKGSLEELLATVHAGTQQILIGTQMLAKGHHFPNVTLVAIVDGDSGLFSADFRAPERMGQLILQVAGRAGRAEKSGTVVIQTHQPQHPLLNCLINEGYTAFIKKLASERKLAELPPFTFSALLRAESVKQAVALQFLNSAHQIASSLKMKGIKLLGPIPAPMERRAGRYRAQLFFIAEQRPLLQKFLLKFMLMLEKNELIRKVRWSLDIDPREIF